MDIFEQSRESYGSPRITKELKARGWTVGKNKVARMMKAADLKPQRRKKFKVNTDSSHNYPVAPNLLDQAFKVSRPGEVWVSDITYVRTHNGWLYLTVIIDLYDRKVIGWSMSKGISAAETVIMAWMMAVWNRPITRKLIFHSDRGSQYACHEFTDILRRNKLISRSMSRKGNCWDNAPMERLFRSLKYEWIPAMGYRSMAEAKKDIGLYLMDYYNWQRPHTVNDGLAPAVAEEKLNLLSGIS